MYTRHYAQVFDYGNELNDVKEAFHWIYDASSQKAIDIKWIIPNSYLLRSGVVAKCPPIVFVQVPLKEQALLK